MTSAADPKHARDDFGVLAAPRFVPKIPLRHAGGSERIIAVRALLGSLRDRPGAWAALMEWDKSSGPQNVVTSFRRGRFGPPVNWECAVRLNPDTKRHVLYVRYVAPKRVGS